MIREIKGDLLVEFGKGNIRVIAHQANCLHTMGSGIAKQIKDKYPEAYLADLKTPKGPDKLGTLSFCRLSMTNSYIFNLYGQAGFGRSKRDTSYDALYNAMVDMRSRLRDLDIKSLGFPALIGCGLGGGDWNVVKAMIYSIFNDEKYPTYIVEWDKN